jgi:general L-amino acid transport system permease protein
MAVSHGQTEAARAIGLHNSQVLRLVVLPQALRVIIPPLASEYLNITKNTSLAVAIGFADLVAVGYNVLNPTGQSIEVIVIWMGFYLGLSIIISVAMNWFNARIALTER